jgi:hypothetical protein
MAPGRVPPPRGPLAGGCLPAAGLGEQLCGEAELQGQPVLIRAASMACAKGEG